MKVYKYIGLLFLLLILSCSGKDTSEAVADYTLLGLTSVKIGDQSIAVGGDGALLDVRNNASVVADGLTSNTIRKQVEISYIVQIQKGDNTDVVATSLYPDVSVQVVKTMSNGRDSYKVTVKRSGYEEQLTYVFHFLVL